MMKLNVIYVFIKKRLRSYFNLQAHNLVPTLTQIDFFVQGNEYLCWQDIVFLENGNVQLAQFEYHPVKIIKVHEEMTKLWTRYKK